MRWGVLFVGAALRLAAPMAAQAPLPQQRPLTPLTPVSAIGTVPRTNGQTAPLPLVPDFGLADLELYDGAVSTVFPFSLDVYPKDSLRAARRARSTDWLGHVHVTSVTDRVWLADLDLDAGQDDAAWRAYDSVLTILPRASPERSFVLSEAIAKAADPTQDDSVTVRRLPKAATYLAQFETLPTTGYKTRHDSAAGPDRQFQSLRLVLQAASRTRQIPLLLTTSQRFFHVLTHWHGEDRAYKVDYFPYEAAYLALIDQPDGRAQIDSIRAHMYTSATLTLTELGHVTPEEGRATVNAAWRRRVDGMMRAAYWLGSDAAPITAHAWLNTPDSLYAPVPRTRSIADSQIHVLLFGTWSESLGQLRGFTRRFARRFPHGVVMMLVTNTDGAIGPDLVPPDTEVAWDRTLYETIGQLHNPTAVWAGAKQPAKYGGTLPEPSPNDEPFRGPEGGFETFIVDGKGVVRARIQPTGSSELEKWQYEERLDEIVRFLLDEAHGEMSTRPVDVMPAGVRSVP